ncbi:hypothetical protein LXL04_030345 [Taraxacum kok-saghyz]
MDEVKALEETTNTNGETSGNLVTNGELENQKEDASKGPEIEQDDRLIPTQEPVIQNTEENKPNNQIQHEISSETLEPEANPESPSGMTNGEISNNEEASKDVSPLEKVGPEKQLQKTKSNAIIDTTAPFESVKAAVSMFGGMDWKAHKIQAAERRKYIIQELIKARDEIPLFKKKSEKAEEMKLFVLKELDETKRLIEELKLNLEKTQTEERQAKQDAELAKLRVEEMEQGINEAASVAAKIQMEVAHARHQAAVSELETVKNDLENLKKDYELLLSERDLAVKNAKEAVSDLKEIEKEVEGLTIKLVTTKEALESAHAAHLEAEESRIGVGMARDEDALNWEKELKQSEDELEKVKQQIGSIEDVKSKLDTATVLLHDLKAELAAYMGQNETNESPTNNNSTHKDMQAAIDKEKTNLEEVNKSIELATNEVKLLKQAANSLNSELEKEKATLISIRQREAMAAVTAASLESDLQRTISEMALIRQKEKEAREKALELPKKLQKAAEEADHAKSLARAAHEELQKAKQIADQAKAGANTMRSKLLAAQKEIEAARASEKLALGAITALQETESTQTNKNEEESGVSISLEDYYELTRKAQEAENQANLRVSEAKSQIDVAKESEVKTVDKLEQVNSDLVLKREELSIATQKAENAKEGKLAVEQELRTWRSESEQRRKAKEAKSSELQLYKPDLKTENVSGSSREGKPRKKKKRFIPRFFMFFSRKKRDSSKSNTRGSSYSNLEEIGICERKRCIRALPASVEKWEFIWSIKAADLRSDDAIGGDREFEKKWNGKKYEIEEEGILFDEDDRKTTDCGIITPIIFELFLLLASVDVERAKLQIDMAVERNCEISAKSKSKAKEGR